MYGTYAIVKSAVAAPADHRGAVSTLVEGDGLPEIRVRGFLHPVTDHLRIVQGPAQLEVTGTRRVLRRIEHRYAGIRVQHAGPPQGEGQQPQDTGGAGPLPSVCG
jgi:hypothetical protein